MKTFVAYPAGVLALGIGLEDLPRKAVSTACLICCNVNRPRRATAGTWAALAVLPDLPAFCPTGFAGGCTGTRDLAGHGRCHSFTMDIASDRLSCHSIGSQVDELLG